MTKKKPNFLLEVDVPIRTFIRTVKTGGNPPKEELERLATILEEIVDKIPRPVNKGPGVKYQQKRAEIFAKVYQLVEQGMSRSDAIQKSTDSEVEYNKVSSWYEKGEHKEERKSVEEYINFFRKYHSDQNARRGWKAPS